MNRCPFGFLIRGATIGRRRLVDWQAAFQGYALCDDRAGVHGEAYLSAFTFGEEFKHHLSETGSTADYAGETWAPWIWLDIDRADRQAALTDTRRMTATILERFTTLDDDGLLLFFSGNKGFHVGLPSSLIGPEPSSDFNRIARRFAEGLAEAARIGIDTGVYDKVRPFRAPNSKHPKTRLHKRRLSHDELMGLSVDGVLQLAGMPHLFDLPALAGADPRAIEDWHHAAERVKQEAEVKAERRSNGTPTLNKLTLDYIRNGADVGDRHRFLFSAAANLAEFGCPPALAHALLTEAGLDCGLPPKDVHRQIECGLKHTGTGTGGAEGIAEPRNPELPGKENLQAQLGKLWENPVTVNQNPEPASQPEPEKVQVHLLNPPSRPARQCWNCKGHRFWLSVHGVVNCATCVEPADPKLVKEWLDYGERGTP